MNHFLVHSDRDLLNFSFTVRYDAVDRLIVVLKRAVQIDLFDLFLCSNPENETPQRLLKNINEKIISDFTEERTNLLNELYPDLIFPPNFWSSIYMEFEVGNFDYRIIEHYRKWVNYQLKYKKFIIPFIFGYLESFLWFYLIFLLFDQGPVSINNQSSSTSNKIIIEIILILCIIYFFHILGIYLSLINIFDILPTFRNFNQYLKDNLDINNDWNWDWIPSISIQKWLCLSYNLKPIEIKNNIHHYLHYFIINYNGNQVLIPLANKYILFMAVFKYIFSVMLLLILLNNYLSPHFYFYSLINIVLISILIILQMCIFGVIMITNYEIAPVTALTIILMTVSCSLLIYGIIIIILYFTDKKVLQQTESNSDNWLSDILIPSLFFACWIFTIYKIKKNYGGYHQWTWIIVNFSCLYEIFAIPPFWRYLFGQFLDQNIICYGIFIAMIIILYIEYQHRLNHAFTCLKFHRYINKYITNNKWIKNCILNAIFGQLYCIDNISHLDPIKLKV